MELVSLRLIDGSNIVAKLDTTCDQYVTVEDPIVIDSVSTIDGGTMLRAAFYMPFSDQSVFTFNRKSIILESDVSKDFVRYYTDFIKQIQSPGSLNSIDKKHLN